MNTKRILITAIVGFFLVVIFPLLVVQYANRGQSPPTVSLWVSSGDGHIKIQRLGGAYPPIILEINEGVGKRLDILCEAK